MFQLFIPACGKFLFALGGVGPPQTRGGSFHEAESSERPTSSIECGVGDGEESPESGSE
jgi:hypothetical protein